MRSVRAQVCRASHHSKPTIATGTALMSATWRRGRLIHSQRSHFSSGCVTSRPGRRYCHAMRSIDTEMMPSTKVNVSDNASRRSTAE